MLDPEFVEFDLRCRQLIARHEHLRVYPAVLEVRVNPYLLVEHYTWRNALARRVVDQLTAYSRTDLGATHLTCYVSQDGSMGMLEANTNWHPMIRGVLPFLRQAMVLDDLANV